ADVDADGDVDILLADPNLGGARWLMNLGARQFALSDEVVGDGSVQLVSVADFDGDGTLDILTGSTFSAESRIYLNRGPFDADFVDDQIVDGFDFLAWQRSFGTTTGQADANDDLRTDAFDLAQWGEQFGRNSVDAPALERRDALASLAAWESAFGEIDEEGLYLGGRSFLAWQRTSTAPAPPSPRAVSAVLAARSVAPSSSARPERAARRPSQRDALATDATLSMQSASLPTASDDDQAD
ncbi:MAG: VCBS repeat-containing protein, partial [Planctomycetales bacterium]|nr:VCBS repeat-containing protein [Planctomycetales bacterium]